MAHPKRQHSKQRSRKRRTHEKINAPDLSPCVNSKKPVISHRVCRFCGFYKGKPVVEIKAKAEKKKQ